jgi:hypothetical protein
MAIMALEGFVLYAISHATHARKHQPTVQLAYLATFFSLLTAV